MKLVTTLLVTTLPSPFVGLCCHEGHVRWTSAIEERCYHDHQFQCTWHHVQYSPEYSLLSIAQVPYILINFR